jgi:hypothetical protein
MPFKDPDRQRAAVRENTRRWRERKAAERMAAALIVLPTGEMRLPDPPDRDELLRLLGVQARRGSVPAIRLLLAHLDREQPEQGQPGVIRGLAERREQRQRSKGEPAA